MKYSLSWICSMLHHSNILIRNKIPPSGNNAHKCLREFSTCWSAMCSFFFFSFADGCVLLWDSLLKYLNNGSNRAFLSNCQTMFLSRAWELWTMCLLTGLTFVFSIGWQKPIVTDSFKWLIYTTLVNGMWISFCLGRVSLLFVWRVINRDLWDCHIDTIHIH